MGSPAVTITPDQAPVTITPDAQQSRGFMADLADKLPGTADRGLKGAVTHLGDTYNAVVKPITDVSAPSIATQIYKRLAGEPNELKALPGKMVTAFALAGEPEAADTGAIPTRLVDQVKAATPPDTPGMPLRVGKVLAKRIPGVKLGGDLLDAIRGPETPSPTASPAPQPPPDFGTPHSLRGQRIPVYPGAPEPTGTPEQINPSLVSPSRSLPGQISPEVIGPYPQPAQPIPARSGLALPPGPEMADPSTEFDESALSPEGQRLLARVREFAARIPEESGDEFPEEDESTPASLNLNEDLTPALKASLRRVRLAQRIRPKTPTPIQ